MAKEVLAEETEMLARERDRLRQTKESPQCGTRLEKSKLSGRCVNCRKKYTTNKVDWYRGAEPDEIMWVIQCPDCGCRSRLKNYGTSKRDLSSAIKLLLILLILAVAVWMMYAAIQVLDYKPVQIDGQNTSGYAQMETEEPEQCDYSVMLSLQGAQRAV